MSLKIVIAVLQPMRSCRADGQACTTANTALGMEPDFCRGPHALWILGPNASNMITGLGIVNDHHLAPTFRMLGTGELPEMNPIEDALRFLSSASKHMTTAIDDVAAAAERLQCLPSPEPTP